MRCPRETGVLPGSEIYFSTVSPQAARLFYYVGCCGRYVCTQGYRIDRRRMDSLLVMLIEQGEMRLRYRGAHTTARAGDIVLLDGSEPHYYDTAGHVTFCWLHLGGCNCFDLCEHLTRTNGGIVYPPSGTGSAAAHIRQLVAQCATGQPVSDAARSRLVYNLLCDLMPAPHSSPAQGGQPVQQAVQFIQTHLSEPLALARIAQAVHLSPSQLTRLFRAELHRTPHEYLILTRMDRAKYLLKTTDLPIKAIAQAVGYGSESSFTAAFTERIGLPPRRFRALPLG